MFTSFSAAMYFIQLENDGQCTYACLYRVILTQFPAFKFVLHTCSEAFGVYLGVTLLNGQGCDAQLLQYLCYLSSYSLLCKPLPEM